MIPKNITKNVLSSDGIKYVPVKVLRNSLDKNELDKFSDWFFGKPVVVGVKKECGSCEVAVLCLKGPSPF